MRNKLHVCVCVCMGDCKLENLDFFGMANAYIMI